MHNNNSMLQAVLIINKALYVLIIFIKSFSADPALVDLKSSRTDVRTVLGEQCTEFYFYFLTKCL